MRTWLVAISLVLGAMSKNEVCYFTTDLVYHQTQFGLFKASPDRSLELQSDDMPRSSAVVLEQSIYVDPDQTFTYDLFSYGLAIKPNSDLVFVASTADILTLTVQGLDGGDLQDIYMISFSTTSDKVNRKQKCPSWTEESTIDSKLPFDQVTNLQGLQWRFTLTDDGQDNGGTFKTDIEDVANLGTVLGTQVETLSESCMISFREKKDKLVVKFAIKSASYLEIVTGHESDSVPKVDGMTSTPSGGVVLVPVIDFQYFNKIASLDTSKVPVLAFKYGADACVDTTNYVWETIVANELAVTTDQAACTLGRKVPCYYPVSGDESNQGLCTQSKFCRWCDNQCVATEYLRCPAANLFDLIGNPDTVVTVDAVTITSQITSEYLLLYLGERLTISCTNPGTHFLQYKVGIYADPDQADYSQLSIDCLVNRDGDVTNFENMLMACKPKCTTLTYDTASVVLSIDIANKDYPYNFPFNIDCVDGYSNLVGKTKGVYTDVQCVNNRDISEKKCYRCEIGTIDANAHAKYYKDNIIFTGDSILPTEKLTLKCDDGYSTGVSSKRKEIVATCKIDNAVAVLDDLTFTSQKCTEDCTLKFDQTLHGLVFELEGQETDIDSIPAGMSYDVKCADATEKLQVGQTTNIPCTANEQIDVLGCRKPCNIEGLFDAKNRYVNTRVDLAVGYQLVPDNSKSTPVAYGTSISLLCDVGNSYSFAYQAPNEKTAFSCDDKTYDFGTKAFTIVTNNCYAYCQLGTYIDHYADKPTKVNKGDQGMLETSLRSLKLDPDTSVRIQCKNADATVGSTSDHYYDVACPLGNDKIIDLKACRPACRISNLKTPTTNTKVGHLTDDQATKIPYDAKAKVYCQSDEYQIGLLTSTTEDRTYLQCGVEGTDGRFKYRTSSNAYLSYEEGKEIVAKELSCLPLPQFPANQKTATGPMKMTLRVTLPQTVDKAVEITEIALISGAGDDLCKITNVDISTTFTDFSCVYTEKDDTKLVGGILDISAKVTYTKPDVGIIGYTKNKISVAYAGPPKLSTELNGKVSATGDVAVTIKDMVNIKSKYGPLNTAEYQLQFEVILVDEFRAVKASLLAMDYTTFVATTKLESFGSFKLQPTTKYTLGVKTYLKGYDGADFEATFFPFETGRTMPSLEVSGTTTTTATVTVTAAETGSLYIKWHVKEFGTDTIVAEAAKESIIEFTNGKATISLTGLKALTKYTIDASLGYESIQGVIYSKEAIGHFTQGPDQPVITATDSWIITDDAVTVSWESLDDYTYYLKLFEKQEDNSYPTDPVAEFVFPVPDNNGRKKRAGQTTVSHTFESLKPHGSYKLIVVTEVEVGGEKVKSASVAMVFQLYACSKADKTAGGLTIKHKASEDAVPNYLKADSNALFIITCPDKEEFKQDAGGVADSETSCEAGGWSAHSACEPIPVVPTVKTDEQKVGVGAIVGIIVAVLVILLAVVLIVFLWRRRGNDTGSSRKYSPRDEEKQNEISGEGGEAWRNPYYRDTEEKPEDAKKPVELTAVVTENEYDTVQEAPDIPANGDNVSMASQEKKIALDDDEDNADVVIDNKAASATEQV